MRGVMARSGVTMSRVQHHQRIILGGARAKSDLVTLEKHGRVGVLRLNDPKRLNPMTAAMGTALQGLFVCKRYAASALLWVHVVPWCFKRRIWTLRMLIFVLMGGSSW